MLTIKNLNVETKDGKKIINNFNINIDDGKIHVIMGPNGTGKSTLSKVIMGHYNYKVTDGNIYFNNIDITSMEVDQRSKSGIFLVNQSPISIDGITNSEFLKTAINERIEKPIGLYEFIKKMDAAVNDLEMNEDMLHRSINKNFSGGERKKNEILQMKILNPKFIILDELDSGLDGAGKFGSIPEKVCAKPMQWCCRRHGYSRAPYLKISPMEKKMPPWKR